MGWWTNKRSQPVTWFTAENPLQSDMTDFCVPPCHFSYDRFDAHFYASKRLKSLKSHNFKPLFTKLLIVECKSDKLHYLHIDSLYAILSLAFMMIKAYHYARDFVRIGVIVL